jgi:glutaminyl-peptide cyclotransferase
MSRHGKQDAKKTEGAGRRKPSGKAAPPPEPEAPSTQARLLNAAITVVLLGIVAFVVWKKFNPPAPVQMTSHDVQEVEKAWKSEVDGARALDLAKRLCALGPRVAGTEGSRAARELIKAELALAGITKVDEQSFKEKTPKGEVEFTNLIGILPGKRPDAIAIAAHYDSKPFDEFHFVGANDAASAVAVVVELARKFAAEKRERELTTYFVFFDGEEAFNKEWGTQEDGSPDHTYGSRYLASRLKTYPIRTLILADMVGEKDISFADDENSDPTLRQLFKETSREVFGVNFLKQKITISDDHQPFIEAGVPAIDLIDFEFGIGQGTGAYGHWHTAEDTVDKLDQRGFDVTGTLIWKAFPRVEKKVLKGL